MVGSLPELNHVDDLLDRAHWQRQGGDELRPGELLQRCPEEKRDTVANGQGQSLHKRHNGQTDGREPVLHQVQADEEGLVAKAEEEEGVLAGTATMSECVGWYK